MDAVSAISLPAIRRPPSLAGFSKQCLLAACAVWWCACQNAADVSQTVVWLDAEPAAQAAFARVSVQANRERPIETDHPTWPIKLVLAPKHEDASRRFTLRVDASDSRGSPLAVLRLRTGFVAEETRYVTLLIHAECATHCESADACNLWSAELKPAELGRSADGTRRLDATCDAQGQDGLPPDDGDVTVAGGAVPATAGTSGAAAPASGAAGAAGSSTSKPLQQAVGPCPEGYERIAAECVDIDECTRGAPCTEHGECFNTPGSHRCECQAGYAEQSGTCEDIDECLGDNGGCASTCINAPGSVACACAEPEHWLKADRKACGSFASPVRVSLTASAQPTQPRFAFDAQGDGLAVWTQSDGTRSTVWTRRYAAATGWIGFGRPLTLEDAGDASVPRVALDASGQGAVVWLQTQDSVSHVWAAAYNGQSVGTPMRLDSNDASASDPSVALDDSGNGFAVWTQSDGTHTRVWVDRMLATSGWTGAQPLASASSSDAFGVRIAIGTGGNAVLAWTQTATSDGEGTRSQPWVARFDPALGRFRLPGVLDAAGLAGLPDVALFEPSGATLAVWTRLDGSRISVWGRRYASATDAGDAIEIATGGSSSFAAIPRVALSPSGSGAALWTQGQVSAWQVWANRYDAATDSWSGAAQLSVGDSTSTPSPALAVDRNGDGFGVWAEIGNTSRTLRAQRLQADTGFVGSVVLTRDATADPPRNSPAQIAVDAQGNALAIWDVFAAGKYEVWASRFQ